MALYPGATKRLIPKWNKVGISRYRRMNLHVAVWGKPSIHSLFSNSNVACSHFYVNKAGGVEQLIDTRYRSAADGHGNDSTISVETEGGLSNVNGEKWTAAQVVALAKLWAWARDTHKIRNQIAVNTNTNRNSEGLSWHRLGIKGNFGGRPGLASKSYGGILYSSAVGKECPGDAKINQIPEIFGIANGKVSAPAVKPAGSVSKPSKPAAKPKPKGTKANRSIQTALKTMGLYKGVVDGINGSMQKSSVKAFQKHHGLVQDGKWQKLTQAEFTLNKKVQKALIKQGYTKQTVDGYYGDQTAANVRDFQRRTGLVQDGMAGPITLKKLGI